MHLDTALPFIKTKQQQHQKQKQKQDRKKKEKKLQIFISEFREFHESGSDLTDMMQSLHIATTWQFGELMSKVALLPLKCDSINLCCDTFTLLIAPNNDPQRRSANSHTGLLQAVNQSVDGQYVVRCQTSKEATQRLNQTHPKNLSTHFLLTTGGSGDIL